MTLAEAARVVGRSPATFKRWVLGYRDHRGDWRAPIFPRGLWVRLQTGQYEVDGPGLRRWWGAIKAGSTTAHTDLPTTGTVNRIVLRRILQSRNP